MAGPPTTILAAIEEARKANADSFPSHLQALVVPDAATVTQNAASSASQHLSESSFNVEVHSASEFTQTKGGKKWKSKSDLVEYPAFSVSLDLEWIDFLETVALKIGTTRACLKVDKLQWVPKKPKNADKSLVSTEESFGIMVGNIRAMKVGQRNSNIYLLMPPPERRELGTPEVSRCRSREPDSSSDSDGEPPTKKQGVTFDDAHEALVAHLKKQYENGCKVHPNILCFHDRVWDLHWELSSDKLGVWASAMYQKKATLEQPPLLSPLFSDDRTLRTSKSAPKPRSGSPTAGTSPSTPSNPSYPFFGWPTPSPSQIPVPNFSPFMFAGPMMYPGAIPFGGSSLPASSAVPAHSPADPLSSPPLPAAASTDDFIEEAKLSTTTREALEEMGWGIDVPLGKAQEAYWEKKELPMADFWRAQAALRRYKRKMRNSD